MVKGTLGGGSFGNGVSLVETVFTTEYITHTHSVALSEHSFLLTFYDYANSDAGTAVAGEFFSAKATELL
jgi:hypothetical protein